MAGSDRGRSAAAARTPEVPIVCPPLREPFDVSKPANAGGVNWWYDGRMLSASGNRQLFSVDKVRCVLSAGGGPDEVSIPWLLRDAGGRLIAGDRASTPDEADWGTKYDSDGEEYEGQAW